MKTLKDFLNEQQVPHRYFDFIRDLKGLPSIKAVSELHYIADGVSVVMETEEGLKYEVQIRGVN